MTGTRRPLPVQLPHQIPDFTGRHAELDQLGSAWRCLEEALAASDSTKERWCEAETHRIAGELTLRSREPNVSKAEAQASAVEGLAAVWGASRFAAHWAVKRSTQSPASA